MPATTVPKVNLIEGVSQQIEHKQSDSNIDADGFILPPQTIRRQKRENARKQKVISGSGSSRRIRGAPEPSREIFVYRVHKETSEEDMRDFMDSNGFDVRAIECTSKPDSLFKSFHVTIPLSQVEKAFDPQLWPEGVRMRKYWPIRKVAESDKH